MNGQSLWNRLTSRFRRWCSLTIALQETAASTPSTSDIYPRNAFMFYPFSQGMGASVYRPKSLPEFNYSAILRGEVGPENFSSDCWLENHLHRFSGLSGSMRNASLRNANQRMCTDESSSSNSGLETLSLFSTHSFTNSDTGSLFHYVNLYQYGQTDSSVVELPPYWDEPPPSYEEAVRLGACERESAACCLTSVDHASEWWMW